MSQDEFTQVLTRSIRAIIKACVVYYGLRLTQFIPKMDDVIAYQVSRETTTTIDVTEAMPQ